MGAKTDGRPSPFSLFLHPIVFCLTCPEGCIIATLKETDIYKARHLYPLRSIAIVVYRMVHHSILEHGDIIFLDIFLIMEREIYR